MKFKTLEQLQEKTENWASESHDDYSNTSDGMSWGENDHLIFKVSGSTLAFPNVSGQARLTEHATHQLLARLDAPAFKWITDNDRCSPELRAQILNALLGSRDDKKWLLRQRGMDNPVIRAVLSDQYARYDHHKLVEAIATATNSDGMNVKVANDYVGDYFRAYIIPSDLPTMGDHQWIGGDGKPVTPTGDGEGGGGLHPAIYIRNDETGGGSLRITAGLYRSFCSNGAIIGWQSDQQFKLVHRSKSEVLMARMVHDAIASALNLSGEAALKFLELQEAYLQPDNLQSIVEGWAGKYGIGKKATEDWVNQVQLEQQKNGATSMHSVINAATFQAQQQDRLDVTEEFERMAGDMIMTPVRQNDLVGNRMGFAD